VPWPHAHSAFGAAAPFELALAWILPAQRHVTCAAAAAPTAGQLHPASWLQQRGSRSLRPAVLPAVPASTAGGSRIDITNTRVFSMYAHPAGMLRLSETLGSTSNSVDPMSRSALDPSSMPTASGLDSVTYVKPTAHGWLQPGWIQWWHCIPIVLLQLDQHPEFRVRTAIGSNAAIAVGSNAAELRVQWLGASVMTGTGVGSMPIPAVCRFAAMQSLQPWLQRALPAAPCCGGAAAP
jgi:hypothetical protein